MNTSGVFCTSCGNAYPPEGVPYCCPTCGGLYDFRDPIHFNPEKVDRSQPGIWRFSQTFNLPPNIEPVSLGEGNTPLIWAKVLNRQVAFKCEFLNPSGSFKDRGTALIIAWLHGKGVTEAVEDSSGNAGASFAAYATRAGIKARIFVPELASGPKRRQIEAFGAELVPISGSRNVVAEAARKVADTGVAYGSHAYIPYNLPGYATAAYEIVAQLGQMPGAVIVPVGQGGLLLGLVRGFEALRIAIKEYLLPEIIGVQAKACAPLWALFLQEDDKQFVVREEQTLAEGVRVSDPLRGNEVLAAVLASRGSMMVTGEDEIIPARNELAKLGFYVEPTSAIVWPALIKLSQKLPDPIVVILTGSGLKYG